MNLSDAKNIQPWATKSQLDYLARHGLSAGPHNLTTLVCTTDKRERFFWRCLAAPAEILCSAIFTASDKRKTRDAYLDRSIYTYFRHVTISYTGQELRRDDQLVWLHLLKLGGYTNFGEYFTFSIADFLKTLGWPRNGSKYRELRACLQRLSQAHLTFQNDSAYGIGGAFPMLECISRNDAGGKPKHFAVRVSPFLAVLFAGNRSALQKIELSRHLSGVAAKLADYVACHKYPRALQLSTLKLLCASTDKSARSFKATVKDACKRLEDLQIVTKAWVDGERVVFVSARPADDSDADGQESHYPPEQFS